MAGKGRAPQRVNSSRHISFDACSASEGKVPISTDHNLRQMGRRPSHFPTR